MSITVEGTRFGTLELADDAVVEFPTGIIGLSSKRWALVAKDEQSAFRWLQSLDDPEIALPVTDPQLFFPEYSIDLNDDEAKRIGHADDVELDANVYVTIRAGETADDFRANLLAPLILHRGQGWQVLNDAPGLSVSAPLFDSGDDDAA